MSNLGSRATAQSERIPGDLRTVMAALIVLSTHLPLFVADERIAEAAKEHLTLRGEAFDALDRIADALGVERPVRVHRGAS